jgi:hypothetical protein
MLFLPPFSRAARASAVCAGAALVAGAAAVSLPSAAMAVPGHSAGGHASAVEPERKVPVRFATYNASLNRASEGSLVRELSTPDSEQARKLAEVIQINAPDVLLVNEFDYDAGHRAADLFRTNYLEVGQNGQRPVQYPYVYVAPSNTGVESGHDLNNDGRVGGPGDAQGFGYFEGQYGMVLYSRYPIDAERVRTFQNFLWKDMPAALLPDDPANQGPADWFTPAELEIVRLSSKSHWDVPVRIGGTTVHVLASHPTPPVFDGDEDRNGRRNSDEIRFWADYISGGKASRYIYDDAGRPGGLPPRERFVVMGDQNSDPLDGDSLPGSIGQLLSHPRVQDPEPAAEGAAEASALQGGVNEDHRSEPRHDTADFEDQGTGNLRADYVLPSRNLAVRDSGIFWPRAGRPGSELTGIYPFPTSDHRLVYADVVLPPRRDRPEAGR